MKKAAGIPIVFILLLCSCNYTEQRRNNKADADEAGRALMPYWSFKINNKIDSLSSVFGAKAFKKTPQSKFDTLFKKAFEQCGSLHSYKIKNWQTLVVNGSNPIGQYQLNYESYCE